MRRWIIALVLAFAVGGVILLSMWTERAAATPAQARRTPVLVELFTSEGCSSCPPADDFLIRLEREQPVPDAEIIAISEHVDYWNRLGWADPFSSAAFSERQNQYARAFGTNQIYTPQMVVDGRTEFIGSQEGKARREIAQAAQAPKAKVGLVKESAHPHDDLIFMHVSVGQLPRITPNDTGEVWLAITEGELSTDVRRGEKRFPHAAAHWCRAADGIAARSGGWRCRGVCRRIHGEPSARVEAAEPPCGRVRSGARQPPRARRGPDATRGLGTRDEEAPSRRLPRGIDHTQPGDVFPIGAPRADSKTSVPSATAL